LAGHNPDRVAVKIGFADPLARRIEAGADMFLMPSRYEPCGLSQLYSLKYGTVPVVRTTGGLRDTVIDLTPATLAAGAASGFCFDDYAPAALAAAMERACRSYAQPEVWRQLIAHGMAQDWSWKASAAKYVALFAQIAARHREPVRG
jgi:starch synthase